MEAKVEGPKVQRLSCRFRCILLLLDAMPITFHCTVWTSKLSIQSVRMSCRDMVYHAPPPLHVREQKDLYTWRPEETEMLDKLAATI